jgi:peptidoglycan/LPS O-acetylase OafA/YrhL
MEGCGAFMKLCCCRCTLKDNYKALFQRKPSALAPLDGMRFMAVMWVFCLHNSMNTFFFFKCLFPEKAMWFWLLLCNGDMGVDIFFVLSGFLIAFVLNREYVKYGDIDWLHFMKMRVLRIYPAMAVYIVLAFFFHIITGQGPVATAKYVLPIAFLSANLVGSAIHKSHIWSVCVEMQFYLFSPYLLKKILRSEKPWMIPLIVGVASTIL